MNQIWYEIVERFAQVHGEPLPHKLLQIGSMIQGWGVLLNATKETQDGLSPCAASLWWNGWPAGVIDAGGGLIAAGSLANDSSFREWLATVNRPEEMRK